MSGAAGGQKRPRDLRAGLASLYAGAAAPAEPAAKAPAPEAPGIGTLGGAPAVFVEQQKQSIVKENAELRAEIEQLRTDGGADVLLDPAQIRDRFPPDRTRHAFEDEAFHALRRSIAEHGQDQPILVRPHATEPGALRDRLRPPPPRGLPRARDQGQGPGQAAHRRRAAARHGARERGARAAQPLRARRLRAPARGGRGPLRPQARRHARHLAGLRQPPDAPAGPAARARGPDRRSPAAQRAGPRGAWRRRWRGRRARPHPGALGRHHARCDARAPGPAGHRARGAGRSGDTRGARSGTGAARRGRPCDRPAAPARATAPA